MYHTQQLKILTSPERLGLVKNLDIWVPHELKENQLTQRINLCDTQFKRNVIDPFLKLIITGDEKWIVDRLQ